MEVGPLKTLKGAFHPPTAQRATGPRPSGPVAVGPVPRWRSRRRRSGADPAPGSDGPWCWGFTGARVDHNADPKLLT